MKLVSFLFDAPNNQSTLGCQFRLRQYEGQEFHVMQVKREMKTTWPRTSLNWWPAGFYSAKVIPAGIML